MHDQPKRVYIERTAVLAKIESSRGTDANPQPETDAFLVGDVELSLNPQTLERNIYRPSFSPTPSQVGRKPMTLSFSHEIKGSGTPGARAKLATLLRGCKMVETLVLPGAASQIEAPIPAGAVYGPDVVWAKDTPPTSKFGSYLVRVVEGGPSASAKMQVFRWNQSELDATVLWNDRFDAVTDAFAATTLTLDMSDETAPTFTVGAAAEGDSIYAVVGGMTFKHTVDAADAGDADPEQAVATRLAAKIDEEPNLTATAVGGVITIGFLQNAVPVTVTSGTTAITLGDSGASITPTWTGSLVKGQMFIVQLYEQGYMYKPLSDDEQADSLTLHAYIDGQLYRMAGVQGTVTFSGTSGEYATAQFEFTGEYSQPVPQPLPSALLRYELSTPPKVELAQLSIRGLLDFCAESFTVTLGNETADRLCMNRADGYAGSEISGRSPTCTVNPEGSLDVYTSMWGDFANGEEVPLHLRVGKNLDNMVRFYMDNATYSGMSLGDRNRSQTMEPTFQLNGVSAYGDDELRISFPSSA